MTLIAIIIALLCERFLSHLRRWRDSNWFGGYLTWLQRGAWPGKFWSSRWGLFCLLPPLLIIGLVQWYLQDGVTGLIGFVFGILILVFTLGPRDLRDEVQTLRAAYKQGDTEYADTVARHLAAVGAHQPEQTPSCKELVEAVILQAHERTFAILFWFFVLGPVGAVGYRLISELPRQLAHKQMDSGLLDPAVRLHTIAAWLPLRINAAIHGLAGSADGAITGWRDADARNHHWAVRGWYMLAGVGCGALRVEENTNHHQIVFSQDEALKQALGLVERSLIITVAIFAILTIGGWLA